MRFPLHGYHKPSDQLSLARRAPAFRRRVRLAVLLAASAGWLAWAVPVHAQGNPAPQPDPAIAAVNETKKDADAFYDNYTFRDGQSLAKLKLHYATLGTPRRNASGEIDNAILMLHWTNASGGALLTPEFISTLYAPGRPLDAQRYFLIFPDNIGHGRSSKPSDGMKASFPNYGYRDMVDLQYRLVTETLGIKRLRAIVGVSQGGMNAWQWAEAYPDAMDGIMAVVSLPTKIAGRNLLWRRMAVRAIKTDPEWNGGNYTKPLQSVADAYNLLRLMIDGVPRFQADIPDEAAADKVIDTFAKQAQSIDANDLMYTIKSSLDYDPEPDLGKIKTKVYALNFEDDEFNPAELRILENTITRIPGAKYAIQKTSAKSRGHLTMAFPSQWADHVATFISQLDGIANSTTPDKK